MSLVRLMPASLLSSPARGGAALCLLAGVAFSVQPIVVGGAIDAGASLTSVLAWRYALAAAVLAVIARKRLRGIDRRSAAGLFVIGAIPFAADAGLFFSAIDRIPVPLASLVHYAHIPLVVAASVLVGGDKLSRRRIASVALVLAGVGLVSGGAGEIDGVGLAAAFGSAAVYAVYMVFSARVSSGVDPLSSATLLLAGSATSFFLVSAGMGSLTDFGGLAGAGAILEAALVGSVVAIGAFFAGLQRVGATKAAILLTIDVPVGILLSAVVLGQQLSLPQLAGAVLVVAAIGVLQVPRRASRAFRLIKSPDPVSVAELPSPARLAEAA